ncbi:MAG: pyruvate kinase [Butyrivibrio sp.]|nr:pyruvate kinase [Butyrivibrio sp.]
MIDVYGTLGPACSNEDILFEMFSLGMTGIRINLSHVMLRDCANSIEVIKRAAGRAGNLPKILIDMQGPELRIGDIEKPIELSEGDTITFGEGGIVLDQRIIDALNPAQQVLLDDGKILAEVTFNNVKSADLKVTRGGVLFGKKSIAVVGTSVEMPALTGNDIENLKVASEYGITGVMQPFVRSADDLKELRETINNFGGKDIKILAKIENLKGVDNLETFFNYADEIVIARGDLGNAVPLWELPRIQKDIASICRACNMPFMVVTQMLSSMEHSKVPTRAEVSDIYNAVLDGAASVMVTGETAVGDNPVEVIRYLANTANAAIL